MITIEDVEAQIINILDEEAVIRSKKHMEDFEKESTITNAQYELMREIKALYADICRRKHEKRLEDMERLYGFEARIEAKYEKIKEEIELAEEFEITARDMTFTVRKELLLKSLESMKKSGLLDEDHVFTQSDEINGKQTICLSIV